MKINHKYLILALSFGLVGCIMYYFIQIVSYVLIAWAISMIGAPLVVFLRKYFGKNIAAFLTLSIFFSIIVVLFWLFIPPVITQAENLTKVDYNQVVNAFEEPIRDWENWLVEKKLMISHAENENVDVPPISQTSSQTIIVDSILVNQNTGVVSSLKIDINLNQPNITEDKNIENEGDFFHLIKTSINEYLNPVEIREIFSNTISAFGNILIGLFSVFFIGFFFLREQGLFDKMLASIVPSQYENQTLHAVDETSKLLIRYLIGILLQVTINTIIVSLLLSLLDIKNALLIGFLAGMLNIIPYLGPIIGFTLGMMITMSSNLELSFYNDLLPLLFKVGIVFLIMQIIDNILLQPIIFSKSVKAHPLEIFIIIMIGAQLGGVMGMILAIPAYTVLRVIGRVFFSQFRVIQAITKNM